MQTSEIFMLKRDFRNFFGVSRKKLNDIIGKTGFPQDLVYQVIRRHCTRTRFPNHHVPHQRGRTRQIPTYSREIERTDRIDEPFQRPILHSVPHPWGIMHGLLSIQFFRILNIEPQEIGQLGGSVDFGLPCGFALAQHGKGDDLVAVFGGDEVCGFEEDGSAVGEGEGRP